MIVFEFLTPFLLTWVLGFWILFECIRAVDRKYYRLQDFLNTPDQYSSYYWIALGFVAYEFICATVSPKSYPESVRDLGLSIWNSTGYIFAYFAIGIIYAIAATLHEVILTKGFLANTWKQTLISYQLFDTYQNLLKKTNEDWSPGVHKEVLEVYEIVRKFTGRLSDQTLIRFDMVSIQYSYVANKSCLNEIKDPFVFSLNKSLTAWNLADKTLAWPIFLVSDVLRLVFRDMFKHITNALASMFNNLIHKHFSSAMRNTLT